MGGDASETRSAIEGAAEELFADLGYAATSIKSMSTLSGRNTALIYYHYRNKATLYRHLIDIRLESISGTCNLHLVDTISPAEIVRRIVSGFFVAGVTRPKLARLIVSGFFVAGVTRPKLARLIAREFVDWSAGGADPDSDRFSHPIVRRLKESISQGQRTGQFRYDVDADTAAVTVIGHAAFAVGLVTFSASRSFKSLD